MIALVASPTISDIKVTEFDASKAGLGIRIGWTNEAGEEITATRFGLTASRLASDIRVATMAGEVARRFYLTGFIRGLADSGGLDE